MPHKQSLFDSISIGATTSVAAGAAGTSWIFKYADVAEGWGMLILSLASAVTAIVALCNLIEKRRNKE